MNYFVEHTSLVVSAPGRSVNSAIEMTVLLLNHQSKRNCALEFLPRDAL